MVSNTDTYESIETKVVRVKDGMGTAHTVKIDRFNGEDSMAMSDAGFGGVNHQFTICDGGQMEAHYDPYKLSIEGQLLGMNKAADMLVKSLHTGGIMWEEIPHDDTLYLHEIEEMDDGSG